MSYKKELEDTKRELQKQANSKASYRMKCVAKQAKEDIEHPNESLPYIGRRERHWETGYNTTYDLAKADQYAKKGDYRLALRSLSSSYAKIKDSPEEMRDKYFDAIEKRIVGVAKMNRDAGKKGLPEQGISEAASELLEEIETERGKRGRKSHLEATTAAAAIIGFLGAIFFLSFNITGNAIGNLTNSTSNIISVIFLLVGIVGAILYFKNKS